MDVLCLGHAAHDLSVYVENFPLEDSKCEIDRLEESGGGPAANAAYLLAKWGLKSAFAGVVGDDSYGHRAAEELSAAGVDISLLERRPGHPTPFSVILVNRRNGSRTIVNRKVPAAPLPPPVPWPFTPRVLLFDGHELPASLAALKAFPQAIAILDAGSWREGTATLAGQVHYLAASARFAQQATGLENLDTEPSQRTCLHLLRELYPTTIATIVTLGDRGLIFDDGSAFQAQPAFPANAVDTTAAGDLFHGALAYGLAQGIPLPENLRQASMAASLSVRKPGGRASAPTLAEVKAVL